MRDPIVIVPGRPTTRRRNPSDRRPTSRRDRGKEQQGREETASEHPFRRVHREHRRGEELLADRLQRPHMLQDLFIKVVHVLQCAHVE